MGPGCHAADRGAAASIQMFDFVRIEEINLLFTDRLHDGPVIPHRPAGPFGLAGGARIYPGQAGDTHSVRRRFASRAPRDSAPLHHW